MNDPMHHRLERLKHLGYAPATVLDIGAYNGKWTDMIKSIYPISRVHCFEAQPGLEANMQATVSRHGPSVSYTMTLLGAEPKDEVDFHLLSTHYGSTGSSMYREITDFQTTVVKLPMRTVVVVLAQVDLPPVDMIKIDVQGAEIDVLKGAPRALAQAQVLLTELSLVNYNEGAPLIDEVLSFLANHDFVLYEIVDTSKRKHDTTIQVDGLFVKRNNPFRQRGFWAE